MKTLFCFLAICLAGVFAVGYSNWGYAGYGAGWPVARSNWGWNGGYAGGYAGGYGGGYAGVPVVRSAGWAGAGYGGWGGYAAPGYGYSGWAGWKKH